MPTDVGNFLETELNTHITYDKSVARGGVNAAFGGVQGNRGAVHLGTGLEGEADSTLYYDSANLLEFVGGLVARNLVLDGPGRGVDEIYPALQAPGAAYYLALEEGTVGDRAWTPRPEPARYRRAWDAADAGSLAGPGDGGDDLKPQDPPEIVEDLQPHPEVKDWPAGVPLPDREQAIVDRDQPEWDSGGDALLDGSSAGTTIPFLPRIMAWLFGGTRDEAHKREDDTKGEKGGQIDGPVTADPNRATQNAVAAGGGGFGPRAAIATAIAIAPGGLFAGRPFNEELFWQEVEALAPGWTSILRDQFSTKIDRRDIDWGWWPWTRHRWSQGSGVHEPITVYLDRSWDELESADQFIAEMRENHAGFIGTLDITPEGTQRAQREAFAKSAQMIGSGLEAGVQFVAVFNPGVDLANTIEDINERGLQADHVFFLFPVGVAVSRHVWKRLRGARRVTVVDTTGKIVDDINVQAAAKNPTGAAAGAGKVAPRGISKIGDLTKEEAAALRNIWEGGPRSQLPLRTREQLAELYSGVARENPAGFAQSAFNQARADYLLGRGPNPGTSVNAFAERMGLPKFRRQ